MWQFFELFKAENPEAYKKLAERGVMVGFPATIDGRSHREDNGIPYHSTVKFFNPDKDKHEDIHAVASKMDLNPPDPKRTGISPGQFKDRFGNDVYVIKLHGPHADQIKGHNQKFSHMGYPSNFEYQPHVSVDKKTWDHVVASKAKTAHEAGISFGPAELRSGHKVLASYKPKVAAIAGGDAESEDKLAASEKFLTSSIIKETIGMSLDLRNQHVKALVLNDEFLSNYISDNPGLKEKIIKKHEERLDHHFNGDHRLVSLALEHGLRKAYETKNRK